MHEPQWSGVRRMTHFDRYEVVMNGISSVRHCLMFRVLQVSSNISIFNMKAFNQKVTLFLFIGVKLSSVFSSLIATLPVGQNFRKL